MRINKNTLWIPSTYFAQGAPYAVMSILSLIFYKSLNVSNSNAALLSSLLVLPWALKPLWVGFLERFQNYCLALLFCQLLQFIFFTLCAISLRLPHFIPLSFCMLLLVAFTMANYDTLLDGFYMHQLTLAEQSFFVGIRTLFYQIARISVQGGLIVLAGYLMQHHQPRMAWFWVFALLALYALVLVIYHRFTLPCSIINKEATPNPLVVIKSFFKLPTIGLFLAFVLLYNFPEIQLQRIVPLFLLGKSGLTLSTSEVGIIYGFSGTTFMILGVLLAGFISARAKLSTYLLPFTALTVLSNLGYLWLSYHHGSSFITTLTLVSLAQFTFGLSNSLYMQSLLRKVFHSPFKMSYYTFLTAIMALGFSLFGAFSGALQSILGYRLFFTWIIMAGSFILLLTLIMVKRDDTFRT